MPRTARIAPGGMVFHVLNRGVGRMRLFGKDRDFEAFEEMIEKTLLSCPMRICSQLIMPNHWHLVLWPENDGELAAFMQKLSVTHVRNWQENRRRVGMGHVYQGRYKSFPVQTDDYFYHVVRYVERNALRANLASVADAWRWSSLWRRTHGSAAQRKMLSAWPLPRPRRWIDHVNQPQTEAELKAIRRCVDKGQPYGNENWTKKTARELGLESTMRRRGRPSKVRPNHQYQTCPVYVPHYTWDEGVSLVLESLRPLGSEYCKNLRRGFKSRWCDRYENVGKRSGAFSCGTFDGDPYILMNYEGLLGDVFTLTHEAGHSMHSFYSSANQPYLYYDYVIFVAEVASTFNEQLLSRHLLAHATDDRQRAYLINRDIDAIRGTIIRQTMFAEFEKTAHAQIEAGEPPTVDSLKSIYRSLLENYFGPKFAIDDALSLECFRIPHFYRAFYVYKYATGLSAAIALAERVTAGGKSELNQYLGFLQGGCSKDPLDLLRDAGVDMETPEPVDLALGHFDRLVTELESLLQ